MRGLLILFLVGVIILVANVLVAYRASYQLAMNEIGPATATYDTTIDLAAASDVNIYSGFVAGWWTAEASGAGASVSVVIDPALVTISKEVALGVDTLRFGSRVGLPRHSTNKWYLGDGQSMGYDATWSGLRFEGDGTGTLHIKAGGNPKNN